MKWWQVLAILGAGAGLMVVASRPAKAEVPVTREISPQKQMFYGLGV